MQNARVIPTAVSELPEVVESLDRIALLVLMDGAAELEIGGYRYRLSLEKVFRLEECSGRFVWFLRNAGALRRRLLALGGGVPSQDAGRVRALAFRQGGN